MGETTEKYGIDSSNAVKALKAVSKAIEIHNKHLLRMAAIAQKVASSFMKAMQPVLRQVNRLKKMAKGVKGAWEKATKGAWGFNNIYSAVERVTGMVTALGSAMMETALEGEKLQAVAGAFEKIGGTAKDMEGLKKASSGLISDAELMRISNSANAFGIATEDLAKMIPIAVGAGQLLGESTEYMLSSIVTGTARGSRMIIDNLGIQISGLAEKQTAYGKKIGKSLAEMTIEEKNHAIVMELEANASKQLSVAESARSQKIGQTAVSMENLTNKLQMMFAETLKSSGAMDIFSGLIASVSKTIEDNQEMIGQLAVMVIDLAIGFGGLLADSIQSMLPLLVQAVPLLQGTLSVATLLNPIFKVLAYVIGSVLNVALRVLLYGIKATIIALEAFAVATGVGVKATKSARVQIDKAIKSLDMQAKKSKKAAKAQGAIAASTRDATQAMREQAALEKIPKSLADAYSQAATEAEGLAEATDGLKRAKQNLDGTVQGARELDLVLGAAHGSMSISQSQLVNSIERAGSDLETQIAILARIDERATAALDQMQAATAGRGGDAGAEVAESVARQNTVSAINAIEDELYKRDAARDKGKQKASKKRAKSAIKSGQDLADAEKEAALMLMSELDKERLEIEESYDSLITMLDGKNEGLVKGLVEGRTKALEEFEAKVSADQAEKRQELLDGLGDGLDIYADAWQGTLEKITDMQDRHAEREKARAENTAQAWQASAQAIGGAASSMFLDLVNSTDSFRDNIFKNLGQLFVQLGTAFTSWAIAEGSLLLGNPWGAMGAAVALSTVGGLISSIGSRKPSSGGGGGSSSAARRAFDDRKNREEAPTQTIIYNLGLSAPDEIAQAISRGKNRGESLRGARKDRPRGRSAA